MRPRFSAILLTTLLAACGDDDATIAADAGRDDAADIFTGPIEVEGSLVSSTGCAACDAACIEENVVYPSRSHRTAELVYLDPPPVAGDHDPCWAAWGIHESPVAPRNFVHNLEHGGLVVLFDCPDGCEAEGSALSAWAAAQEPGTVLLTPYDGLSHRFAVLAWEHRLLLDCVDIDALNDFRDRRAGRAPESVTSMPPSNCMP